MIQQRFLRAFGIDYNQGHNRKGSDTMAKIKSKLQAISLESPEGSAPDTFISWKTFLHLNALMKYQKGTSQMFIDMWMTFIDQFHHGFVNIKEIKLIFGKFSCDLLE